MAGDGGRLLVVNGVVQPSEPPPISTFLEKISGAYTTTRTYGGASVVLFFARHLRRLADSARILAESRASPAFVSRFVLPPSKLQSLVDDSLQVGLRRAKKDRMAGGSGEELAITALVRGCDKEEADEYCGLDVYVHIGCYAPQVFGTGARLAVAGPGRETAQAKYTEWVRVRKHMERLRPPLTTEVLLSNDGDRILEGSVTNFFVVCRLEVTDTGSGQSLNDLNQYPVEVQTAPVSDGVLPGVVRQLVIEICSEKGIPIREVAPSWADREHWEEAFITNSLRLLQHVEMIQVPTFCEEIYLEPWRQVSWVEKQLQGPGLVTTEIQKAILDHAHSDGFPLSNLL